MSAHLEGEQLEAAEPTPSEGEHLAGCEACRVARRDAAGRRRLLGGLRPYTLSDLAFRRVEARLMEQAEQGLPGSNSPWRHLWWAGPLVAAMGVLVWLNVPPSAQPGPTPVGPPTVELAVVGCEPLTVLQASGGSRVRRGTAWLAIRAGEQLVQGEAFAGDVRLAPASETQWTFEVSGSAAIGGAGTLTLGVGEVRARVAGAQAIIAAAGLQVIASEAVFLVSSTAAEVLVEVAEGELSLSEASVARPTTLKAPARVRWAPGSKLVPLPVVGVTVLASPPKPWVRFDAMGLPEGGRLSLDGFDVGATPLEVLVGMGRHRVGIEVRSAPARESWVNLTGDYRLPVVLDEPVQSAPPPDAAALTRVQAALARSVPRLAACYEKWLKENANAQAEVELHLVVGERGQVTRAKVVGSAALSQASVECLVRTAKGLALPPLGTEVELELPLKLRTTQSAQ